MSFQHPGPQRPADRASGGEHGSRRLPAIGNDRTLVAARVGAPWTQCSRWTVAGAKHVDRVTGPTTPRRVVGADVSQGRVWPAYGSHRKRFIDTCLSGTGGPTPLGLSGATV